MCNQDYSSHSNQNSKVIHHPSFRITEKLSMQLKDIVKAPITDPIVRIYQQELEKQEIEKIIRRKRAPGAGRPLRSIQLDAFI